MNKFIKKIYRDINKLPKKVCIEACSLCQLNCTDCYMRNDYENCVIKSGFLTFKNFKNFIKRNPYIEHIELSLSGEIFLNPELLKIIKYAHKKRINLTAFNGVNFNTISEEMIEALVKYDFKGLTFSIDGTTNETYKIYRRNGNLDKVIKNIEKLNFYKNKYNSKFPILKWQFIVFEHNKHEILQINELAEKLKIDIVYFKKPWNSKELTNETKKELLKIKHPTINDGEIIEILKINNIPLCLYPWLSPQINWDGTLLGCCCSTHHSLEINAFEHSLKKVLNSKKIKFMKNVLQGIENADETIQCTHCDFYKTMKSMNKFIDKKNIKYL